MMKAPFETYGAYKDSGVEWIREVPDHWEIKRIKDLVLVKRGASPRPIDDPIYFDEYGEFSWVRIADLSASERYLLTTKEKLSQLGSSLSVKRYPGDFILSIAGTVGKPIITKIKCCIHDGFVWFPNLKINPEYLYYLFSTGLPYQGLGKLGTQLNLNTETVGLISLPLPTNSEISSIVNYLDVKIAQIDRKIDLLTQKAIQYGNLKQSLINETTTHGLDKTIAMKDSGVEWIRKVPAHWTITHLKRHCINITDGAHTSPDLSSSDFPFLTVVNLKNGVLDFKNCLYTSSTDYERLVRNGCQPKKYDVLYSKDGTISETAVIREGRNFVVGSSFVIIRPRLKVSNSGYLSYLLQSHIMRYQARIYVKGASLPRISIFNIAKLISLLPPLSEQKAIADYLDTKTTDIDHIVENINTQIDKLKELRKTLIYNVVTGKIKVV